jgi:hypothetical protein
MGRRRSVKMTMTPVACRRSTLGLVGGWWLMMKMRKTWARPQLVVAELAHIYISYRARVGVLMG